jgi:hypothetical protein
MRGSVVPTKVFTGFVGTAPAPFGAFKRFFVAYKFGRAVRALLHGGDMLTLFVVATRFNAACGRQALAPSNATCVLLQMGAMVEAANGMRAHADA